MGYSRYFTQNQTCTGSHKDFSPVVQMGAPLPRRRFVSSFGFRSGVDTLAGDGLGGPNSNERTDTEVLQVYCTLCKRVGELGQKI